MKRESINIHSEKEATHSKYKLLFQFTISKAAGDALKIRLATSN